MTKQAGEVLPVTLRWAIRLVAGEAVALAVVALVLAVLTAFGDPLSMRLSLIEVGASAVFAALLGGLGYALAARHRWARGPTIVLQLMLLPVGYFMVVGGLWWVGMPVLVLGLFGGGLLLAPASREALGIH